MASTTPSLATPKQAVTALLTEHFRYTPLTLLDDIINTVNELIYRAVTAVEEGLNDASPASLGFAERAAAEGRTPDVDEEGHALYPEARGEIENGVHQLETLLESTVDKNFDKLEIYALRNILTVPEDLAPWMRLSHYRGLDFSSMPNAPTVETLQGLRRKVQETQKLNNMLQTESRRNTAIIAELRSLLQSRTQSTNGLENSTPSLAFLTSNPAAQRLNINFAATGNGKQPLQSTTSHAIMQLSDLRQLHATLQAKVGQLSAKSLVGEAEERRDYIESQTRRRLEKDGIDVDSGEGLSRSGHVATALGRSVGNDEIRAIEQVVGLMGGSLEGPTSGGADDDVMME